MDVGDFLRELGLHQYEAAFRENGIDIRVLSKLTAGDLKDLGVTMVGQRRPLLEAIATIREPTTPTQPRMPQTSRRWRDTQASPTADAERRHSA
jgi:hypothetical protein